MKLYHGLVTVIVVTLLIDEALSISLPSLFGTRVTKEESAKEDVPLEHQDQTNPKPDKDDAPSPDKDTHAKPTRPPILLGIPHPADHPLHPHNNPNHPLHPDNLPHLPTLPSLELPHLPALPPLPPLPSLPHFTRETIHATKTVFVEVTDKVTVHPVCMTVYKVTPPCLPYHPHPWRQGEEGKDRQEPEEPVIQPTAAPQLISPTASYANSDFFNLEPTRILGGEFLSDSAPAPSEQVEADSLELEEDDEQYAADEERKARYVEITPPIKVEEAVQIKDDQSDPAPADNSGLSPLNMVQHLIHRSPVTHYKTKTLWVTKVEKVLDTRVTATLIAKNCIPTNSQIPYCAPHGGLLGPGFHGHHGEGTFLEAFGGAFISGGFVDKVDGQIPPEQHDQTQHVEEQSAPVVEAPVVEAAEAVKQQTGAVEEHIEEETTNKEEVEGDEEPNETEQTAE